MLSLACALLLAAGFQSPAVDRVRAEELARTGRTTEAIELFTRIVQADPADVDARQWLARLFLRSGRTAEAEAIFRAVTVDHPNDIDARVGLASALLRRGAWEEALAMLREVEPAAGNNADVFAALARAYRRSGDDRSALEYFARARTLAPDDADLVMGYEAVARVYNHWFSAEGFTQSSGPGTRADAGTIVADIRIVPRLRLSAMARVQGGPDYSDAIAGGGVMWRIGRSSTLTAYAFGGPRNVALATKDFGGEVMQYAGAFEFGGSLRRLMFAGADVTTASPLIAWTPVDPWRFDARYTYSRSDFSASGDHVGDHSVAARATWQFERRAAMIGGYAYGIESFDDLTSDRIGSLGGSTLSAGLRLDVRSLTRIAAAAEHQWRSNSTTMTRFTLNLLQVIP